jgi:hypothetical protein
MYVGITRCDLSHLPMIGHDCEKEHPKMFQDIMNILGLKCAPQLLTTKSQSWEFRDAIKAYHSVATLNCMWIASLPCCKYVMVLPLYQLVNHHKHISILLIYIQGSCFAPTQNVALYINRKWHFMIICFWCVRNDFGTTLPMVCSIDPSQTNPCKG